MDNLLDRFLRYVKIETTAVEQTDSYPSSPGQFDLGRLLVDELRALSLDDVSIDEHGIVLATVPATVDDAPTTAWLAHMDTSPEFTANGVKPIVHRDYDGKDIVLAGDPSRVISLSDTPELADLQGKTLITTDGTTLLGADDKSGIAVVMTAAAKLMADRSIKHGPIRIVFTCDEEVGRGTDKLDLGKINATCAYTIDSEGAGHVENETFSADLAVITITGKNIHPGLAQDRMVNAIRLASEFVSKMPWQTLSPESTAGRDGFMHPYVMEGGVERVSIRIILRSFVTAELQQQGAMLRQIADTIVEAHPKASIEVDIKKQYRNMKEFLSQELRAVALATQAIRNVGMEPISESIRGGTDGSRLSEMGLPTPNLSAGMHNYHSPLEFACLEEMESAVHVLIELAKLWGLEKKKTA